MSDRSAIGDDLLIANDYESLKRALDQRRRALRYSMIEVDSRVGWADGFASKIFCGARNLGAQSLGELLQALGVCLIVAEMPPGGKTFRVRAIRRDAFLKQRQSEIARSGALARNAQLTPEERREACRKAALAGAAKRRKRAQMALLGRIGRGQDPGSTAGAVGGSGGVIHIILGAG